MTHPLIRLERRFTRESSEHTFLCRVATNKIPNRLIGFWHTVLCSKIAPFKQIKIVLPITSHLDAIHRVFKIWAFILPKPPHATIYHHHTYTRTPFMNLSTQIRKCRVPQRQLRDSNQTLSGRLWHESSSPRLRLIAILTELESPRRSSRLQSRQPRTSYEPRGPSEQRSTDPKTSQPVGVTSHTHLPTSNLVDALEPLYSIQQLQGWLD